MFMKSLTAGVLAVSLSVTSLAPTPATADISTEDAFAGILTLLFLGAAIHNSRDNDTVTAPQPTRPSRPAVARDWRVLPVNCLRDVTRRNGNTVRIFGQRCLNNNYAHVNRLPEACHVRIRTDNGQRRQGFRSRCLRNQGFRTTRH